MKKYITLGMISFTALLLAGCGTQTQTTAPIDTIPEKKVALSTEGGTCATAANCETGLKCITGKCSSGKVNSACATYKDCTTGLYCIKSVCSNPPSYAKYFTKITVGKMKMGMPPGPNNIPVPTAEFSAATDAIEIDMIGKAGVKEGEVYYDLVDLTTGETVLSMASNRMKIDERGGGMGLSAPTGANGDYDLNVYFNNELIYTTTIKINP